MERSTAEPTAGPIPGPRARRWIDYHHRHAAPSEYSHEFVWDVTREASGPFVTDVDGNVLLDFTCHIGAAPLGYNNEKILDKLDAFAVVDPLKIAGQDMYFGAGADPESASFPGASHLMEKLTDVSAGYGMDTVFLSNSGAEAVENAMKVVYDGTPGAKYGFAFTESFHGRTLGTLSVTASNDVYTRRYPQIAGVRTIPFCDDRTCDAASCECGFFTRDGSQLGDALHPERGHIDPEEVAFVILEPIQGVGGYRFPSTAFMAEIQAVCDRYDISLVVDEIQTGVGRTGTMWASEHYPIEPDVIASAKALRLGATISRSDVFPAEKNRLGSTFGGGDVLASMQAVFTLEAIEEYDLLDNAIRRGRQAKERLRDEIDGTGAGVVDVRGKGLLLAVEFSSRERRDNVIEHALRRGLLTLGCGTKTLRLLPPLDVTEREIDLGVSLLCEAIDAAA